MNHRLPDFKARAQIEHERLGFRGACRLLDEARRWDLAPVLERGGSLIFPHVGAEVCGHQVGAAVNACLDCGAARVVVLGVLHALTPELDEARRRVAEGGDPAAEEPRGIQGPGLDGGDDWRREFSLDHFLWLWRQETRRRDIVGPELLIRYPWLAAGCPDLMPGIGKLQEEVKDAAIVGTADPFHHGVAYGDSLATALFPERGGLKLARYRIEEGMRILHSGDYRAYNRHCISAKSDARDVGQVLRYLRGPLKSRILDLVADDMTGPYNAPAPTWVAGALLELLPGR
ncbi:MAG: hypothetical protein GY835_16805 [bacterium]|nr:hypothetical protein [bacterium]